MQGQVTDADDKPVAGAVVQLKDMHSLQIRSFVTRRREVSFFRPEDRDRLSGEGLVQRNEQPCQNR